MKSMNATQFVAYAQEVLFGEAAEPLFEQISEAAGEIAMFGDAGPGALYRLRESVAEYNAIGRQWARLTGQPFRQVALPSPR